MRAIAGLSSPQGRSPSSSRGAAVGKRLAGGSRARLGMTAMICGPRLRAAAMAVIVTGLSIVVAALGVKPAGVSERRLPTKREKAARKQNLFDHWPRPRADQPVLRRQALSGDEATLAQADQGYTLGTEMDLTMAVQLVHELTPEDAPLRLEELRDAETRRRLSAPAIALFLRAADLWDLRVEERMAILGGVSRQTYHNWKSGKVATLTRDQIERISLTLGVLKGLRLIFAEDQQGLRWLKSANQDAGFHGRSPLALMTDGGVSGLYEVRRYLDAWRGVK